MANLKADSPLCRRIVPSFLDFLNSVEPSSVSDKESLKVAIDCLSVAFKLDSSSTDSVPKSDSLVQIFSSQPDQNDAVIGVSHVSSTVNDPDSKTPVASQTLSAAGVKEKGVDKDPEVVESSSKKKKKKKNKNRRRKNKLVEPLKKIDSDNGGSSSQNSGNLEKADSTLCRRIARSYFNFLNSAERSSVSDEEASRYVLSNVLSSYASSTVNDPDGFKTLEASQTLGDTDEQDLVTESEDELFFQFHDALQKARLFQTAQNEVEVQLQTAWMFEGALQDLKKAGVSEFNFQNMADTFKIKGNKCMEKEWYTDAVGHYTAAIALFDGNAVYYCNRAAAYTQTKQHTEAISDCEKAIEIDPSYTKAYSRLGFAYHAQGNYMDAIEKGYKKALELDPNNESVKGNIRAAERKYMEADTFHVSSGLKDLNTMTPETIQSLFEEDPQNPVTESEIELYYQFRDALEKARFFGNTPIESTEVQFQAVWMFEGALQELKKSGVSEFDLQKMADTFKLKGNRSMEKKLYKDAIGHYSAAIALFDDNAVYYCNRAAAYTRAKLYTEAIFDCHKAVAIDPSYTKAYSRLGFAYHAQGNYMDAIKKGYKKALQLDPDNETIKANIQAAEQKLVETLGSAFQRFAVGEFGYAFHRMFGDGDGNGNGNGTQDNPRGN